MLIFLKSRTVLTVKYRCLIRMPFPKMSISLADIIPGLRPVSYTHLDVYKRQTVSDVWHTRRMIHRFTELFKEDK